MVVSGCYGDWGSDRRPAEGQGIQNYRQDEQIRRNNAEIERQRYETERLERYNRENTRLAVDVMTSRRKGELRS